MFKPSNRVCTWLRRSEKPRRGVTRVSATVHRGRLETIASASSTPDR
jgi:hypothetical protein